MTTAHLETADARRLRTSRQRFAAPGGMHDRLVRLLAFGLPVAIGAVAAAMIFIPLSPRGEVSFLLDRNKVAVVPDRLRIDNALYRGQDRDGQPFSLTAGEAVQQSQAEGVVRMQDLVARMLLPEGPARVSTGAAQFAIEAQVVDASEPVLFTAADGYRMLARGVEVDLRNKEIRGEGGVSGVVPAGSFRANRITADLDARVVTLEGDARLRMVPGQGGLP